MAQSNVNMTKLKRSFQMQAAKIPQRTICEQLHMGRGVLNRYKTLADSQGCLLYTSQYNNSTVAADYFFRSDALHTIVQPVEIVGSYGGVIILHDNGSIRIDVYKRQTKNVHLVANASDMTESEAQDLQSLDRKSVV